MADMISLDEFLMVLRSACESQQSAAFFITTEKQHSAMITLHDGQISGLKYRLSRGYDAAEAIARVSLLRFRQAEGPTRLPGASPLNTRAVLEILSVSDATHGSREHGNNSISSVAVDLKALRVRYLAAVGPIGGMLFDEIAEELGDSVSTPSGVRQFVERLAGQIDDQAEVHRFMQDALAG